MSDRFDFEQQILDCWGITNDIQTLLDSWDSLTEDQKLNIIIGLKSLYDAKFNLTFNTFEDLVHKGEM